MRFLLWDRMWERIERSKQGSDTELFYNLMLAGELLAKLVTLGVVAAIKNEPERYRYRQLYRLVRADGIGEWDQTINSVLVGPPSQYLYSEALKEFNQLTASSKATTWQYDSVRLLHGCVQLVHPECENLASKTEARKWFYLFSVLRNKTRGHGAEVSSVHSRIAEPLEASIKLWTENFVLFQRPWAFLHRNLSGKYRVTKISQDVTQFNALRLSQPDRPLPDGVYVYFDEPVRVELLESDADTTDFFLANGNFRSTKFSLLSYITGAICHGDGSNYLLPVGSLPRSETQGLEELDLTGNSFSNLPPAPSDYIQRSKLENELARVLQSRDRYPVVTLVGRGGIGKTYLASRVLHELAKEGEYGALFWFSARDIDLLPSGPKPVKPHVLTARDVAKEFARLAQPNGAGEPKFDPVEYMQRSMTKSQEPLEGSRIVFVFDNFETVDNPNELFLWIDTYIRSPNKVLITTRHRGFKGDYPVEVTGMSREEFERLTNQTAARLGISDMLTREYRDDLYSESEGHPYVVKILLGEVAKARQKIKIPRLLADKDHILEALFERTYVNLSLEAQRVFLTLCSWRSLVPQVALEAVLLRPGNERMNVHQAINELIQCSFVEMSVTDSEDTVFLGVPLVAKLFGTPKLRVSPLRSAIEGDIQLLQAFGAANQSDIRHGIAPRINALIRFVDEKLAAKKESIDGYTPVLEFVARKYPLTWLQIANLYENHLPRDEWEPTAQAIRSYLEYNPSDLSAWTRLSNLYQRSGNEQAMVNALISMCMEPDVPFEVLSSTANSINRIFHQQAAPLDAYEKSLVVSQLTEIMEKRADEADADDCARMAWLFLHLRNPDKAYTYANKGVSMDPGNFHCSNVIQKIDANA